MSDTGQGTQEQPLEPPRRRVGRARRIVAVVLVVFASVFVLLGTVATWTERTIVNEGEFTSIVISALDDPEVFDAVVAVTSGEIMNLLEDSGVIEDVLPDRLSRLEPLLEGALRGIVEDQVANLLGTDQAREAFELAVERAHNRAIDLLEGGGLGDGISVESGEVTLNLLPLLGMVVDQLQDRGFVPEDFDIESALDDGSIQEQIDQLEDEFGVDLPDDLGQIVVYSSDNVADAELIVEQAQRVFALFRRAVVLIDVLAVVFVAAALLVSTNRMRTLSQLGIGVAFALVLCTVVVNRVSDRVPDVAKKPGARAATDAIVDGFVDSLQRTTNFILVLSITAGVAGFVFGRSESAARIRRMAVAGSGTATRTGAGWAAQLGQLIKTHPDGARVAVVVVAVLLLFITGLSWASLIVLTGLVVLAFVGINHYAPPDDDGDGAGGPDGVEEGSTTIRS